jgi:hypothetical protein
VSAALALGARFRGHDSNVVGTYAHFCNEVQGLIGMSEFASGIGRSTPKRRVR